VTRKYSAALSKAEKDYQRTERPIRVSGLRVREKNRWESFVKRFLDVVVSILVLILGLPFFLAIALMIKLTSKGPVLFRQKRIGEKGKPFSFHKFRTMRVDTDDTLHRKFTQDFIRGTMSQRNLDGNGATLYKLTKDPRVTPVGSFLRKTSLDELPQFINILRGEMALVGPRPPVLYEYDCYEDWHKLRLAVKPGLTGLWQVSGRSSVPFHEMVMLDLYYIENWSLKMDLRIIAATIPVMLAGTGGY
jgi:exopolysaccharide biosynthesis polyprenyl glycosylphosphotransferase